MVLKKKKKSTRKISQTIAATDSGHEAALAVSQEFGGHNKDKPAVNSFDQLELASWIVDSCRGLHMLHPTEIQTMSIPPILSGRNVAGNAQTGSGKTACYCLPILHHLSKEAYGVFALVLLPMRELTYQVSENFTALGKRIRVQVAEVVGGQNEMIQSQRLADRVHVVVATPGRLAHMLRSSPALIDVFQRLRFFVLDEADMLLTETFEDPLGFILTSIPKTRQTLLFSATLTKSILTLQRSLGAPGSEKELLLLDANPHDAAVAQLKQEYLFVPELVQTCYLHYLMKQHFAKDSCIIFAHTIRLCQLLTTMLQSLGFSATGLHSLQPQRERLASLGKFRSGKVSILVATDLAGRGLDIPKVSVVVNVGLPLSTDVYVHRAGRTARAGRPGLVLSLITEKDVPRVPAIEERMGKLQLRPVTEDTVMKLLSRTTKAQQQADLLLSEVGFEEKLAEHQQAKMQASMKRKAESHSTMSHEPVVGIAGQRKRRKTKQVNN